MDAQAILAGALARAHMDRANLTERLARLSEGTAKALRQMAETDLRIYDLEAKIQRVTRRAAA